MYITIVLVYMYLILSIVLVKKIVRKRHLSFLLVFSISDIARLPLELLQNVK